MNFIANCVILNPLVLFVNLIMKDGSIPYQHSISFKTVGHFWSPWC